MNENPKHSSRIDQKNGSSAKITVVTDSIAQVPDELVHQLGIHVVPFSVVVEGKIYTDLVDLNLNELYQRMRQEKELRLSTSAPSVGQYYETFKECWQSGADSLVYVGITSRLSHGFSSAAEAARMMGAEAGSPPVYLYDSRLATVAQGFLAIEAAKLASRGVQPEVIIQRLAEERKRIGFAASLETLEYLAKGGRIGKAAYMLGSAMHIHPIISLNIKGEVTPVGRSSGHQKMIEEIIRYTKKKSAGCRSISLAVMHANAEENAEKLKAMAVEQFHPDEIYITDFTPTMVAHTGPGLLGLAYHWRP
jgi:DegV family protein with EDD domain